MNPFYEIVAERAGYVCEYCRAPLSVFNFSFEVDHFIPLSMGGSKDLENLVLSCRACNAYKAFHLSGLVDKAETKRLFNPRRDVWEENFRFNSITFEIEGLTEIGRGTVNRLKINSRKQIEARRLWVEFGKFP